MAEKISTSPIVIKSANEENLTELIKSYIFNAALANSYERVSKIAKTIFPKGKAADDCMTRFSKMLDCSNQIIFAQDSLEKVRGFLKVYYALMGSEMSLDVVKQFINIFLTVYPAYVGAIAGDGVVIPYEKNEKKLIANTAIATYLEYWLENSDECKTDVPTYSNYGFKLDKEKNQDFIRYDDKYIETPKTIRQYKDVNLKLYRKMQKLTVPTQASEDVDSSNSTPNKKEPFLDFAFSSAYKAGGMALLNYTLFSKRVSSRKSSRNAQQNKDLEQAWSKQYNYYNLIDQKYNLDKPMQIREYVMACILMQKIEKANHFQLYNQIALTRNSPKASVQPPFQGLAAQYWATYSFDDDYKLRGYLFPSVEETTSEVIMGYRATIDTLYATTTKKNAESEIRKSMIRRALMIDLLYSLFLFFPVSIMPKWDSTQFKNAAKFYHDDYNFIKEWLAYKPPEIVPSPKRAQEAAHLYYDRYHEILRDHYNIEGSTLEKAVKIGTSPKNWN